MGPRFRTTVCLLLALHSAVATPLLTFFSASNLREKLLEDVVKDFDRPGVQFTLPARLRYPRPFLEYALTTGYVRGVVALCKAAAPGGPLPGLTVRLEDEHTAEPLPRVPDAAYKVLAANAACQAVTSAASKVSQRLELLLWKEAAPNAGGYFLLTCSPRDDRCHLFSFMEQHAVKVYEDGSGGQGARASKLLQGIQALPAELRGGELQYQAATSNVQAITAACRDFPPARGSTLNLVLQFVQPGNLGQPTGFPDVVLRVVAATQSCLDIKAPAARVSSSLGLLVRELRTKSFFLVECAHVALPRRQECHMYYIAAP